MMCVLYVLWLASRDEVMSNSEEIKPIASSIVKLCLVEAPVS